MISNRCRYGVASLVLALALPACGDTDGPGSTPEPAFGGTAVVVGSHDLQNMNGLIADEQDTADLLKHGLSTTLVRLDADLAYQPYLAESWEEQGDTAIAFQLRRDVPWHDGRPTTAADVVFTFERVKDPETGSSLMELFAGWESAEAVDSFTVRFRIRPHPDPLYPWTELPLVPRHLLDTIPAAAMRQAAYNTAPVGNGPFRFVSHRENDRWVFEANPDFPESLGGRPFLDRLIWRAVPESAAQIAELRTGNAHLATSPRTVQLPQLESDPAVEVVEAPSNNYAFIGWNTADPLLSDARVRRALTHAIDRQAILDGLRGGYGAVAFGPLTETHWARHPSLEPLDHDPDRARALLEEAAWTDRDGDSVREDADGTPLAITLKVPAGIDFSRDVAEVVRSHLAEVGVRLETRPLEAATLFADITAETKRFQGVLLTLAADFRLDLRDTFHSDAIGQPFQLSSWSSPELDALMDRLAETTTRDEAVPLWHGIQEELQEGQPWTFLYHAPTILARQSDLRGVRVDARGMFVTLPEWWLAGAGDTTQDGQPTDAADASR